MVEPTRKESFRKSKASFFEVINGRKFFISQKKANKNVVELFDVETGILVAVTTHNTNYIIEWCKQNYYEVMKRLKPYDTSEPSLFD